MARPLKMGVDYFPLDTTLDLKFELLEAEYGLKAFAIVVKLYQMIYGQQGYYCEWNEDVGLLFSRKCNEGCNLVSEIVGAAIKRGIFDEDLYSKYGILTSRGIQSRYIEMKKGDISKIENDYLLLNAPKKRVFAEKTPVSAEKTSVSAAKIPQSKVKESKVNKSKVNKNIYTAKPSAAYAESISKITDKWNTLEIYDIPKVIKMTSEMPRYKRLKKLLDDYGLDKIIEAIDYIPQSDFLLGRTDGNWRIDFDFFVRPDKFLKILEGGYSGKKVKKPSAGSRWDALAEEYNKREDDIIDV